MTRATFDEGFELAIKFFDALELAGCAATSSERLKWTLEARTLGNKITPAAMLSAAPAQSEVANEALRWIRHHDGEFNCSEFIAHCRAQGIGQRLSRKADRVRQLSDSAIRKIVTKKLSIVGMAGRPPKG